MKKIKQKIVWGIDPFEEKNDTRTHVEHVLHDLSRSGATIDPVYILSPDEYDINLAFNAPWLKHIGPTVEKVLQHYLRDLNVPGLTEPKLVIERQPSLGRSVKSLLSYAKRIKADAILVGTHGKKGLPRFLLGSFAETLLAKSTVPLLIVGPQAETNRENAKSSKIMFPTDFGPTAFSIFKKVLAQAKLRQSDVELFHCLPHPVEPYFQSGVFLLGGGYLSFPDFLTKDEEKKRRLAEKYVAAGKTAGVKVEVKIISGQGSAAHAIVEEARKEKIGLITMSAESGTISAALIGSVTRQVVRSSPCPVWVTRSG